MKKLYTFVLASVFAMNAYSQGQITGFTVSPAAPTTVDNVTIYVDVLFNSGGCAVANQGSTTSGSTSTGYALHCLGMLSMMCSAVDTFNLGMLPAGVNTFSMTLSSGMGGPPCSPGFAPDDNDMVTFTVNTATGIAQLDNSELLTIAPNPVSGTAVITVSDKVKLKDAELKIMDLMGRTVSVVSHIEGNKTSVNMEGLPSGVYFYQLTEAGETVTGKLVKE